jgi:tRNA(fMet)-specific endonuclease VapC
VILLDTDHVTILKYAEGVRYERLIARAAAVQLPEFVAVPVVAVEEQMRGWLAVLAKERLSHRQVASYRELAQLFSFFSRYVIAPFSDSAADRFDGLKAARLRMGTMDLKIAAIALVQDALLLSANLRDFGRVPGLRVENWLD